MLSVRIIYYGFMIIPLIAALFYLIIVCPFTLITVLYFIFALATLGFILTSDVKKKIYSSEKPKK